MINKKIIVAIVLFIIGGLFIYSFANPLENLESDESINENDSIYDDEEEISDQLEDDDSEEDSSDNLNEGEESDIATIATNNSVIKKSNNTNTSKNSSNKVNSTNSSTNNNSSISNSGTNTSNNNSSTSNGGTNTSNNNGSTSNGGTNVSNNNGSTSNGGTNTSNNNGNTSNSGTNTPNTGGNTSNSDNTTTPVVKKSGSIFTHVKYANENSDIGMSQVGNTITFGGRMKAQNPYYGYTNYINIRITSKDTFNHDEIKNATINLYSPAAGSNDLSSEIYIDANGHAYIDCEIFFQKMITGNSANGDEYKITIDWGYGIKEIYTLILKIEVI